MPVSGSYHYPVAQKPNSSYPTVDLRPGSAAEANTALGRIYVDTALGDLHYVDPSGNDVIVAAADGSGSFNVFNTIYVSGSIIGPDDLVVSASQGIFFSSSITIGNETTTSPELRFSNGTDSDYFGMKLISGGTLFYTDSGTFTFQADVDGGSNAGYVFKHGSKSTGGGIKLLEVFEDGINAFVELDMQGNDLILDADGDTYIDVSTDDTFSLTTGGGTRLTATNSLVSFYANLDTRGNSITNSTGASNGDVVVADNLQISGGQSWSEIASTVTPSGTTQTIDFDLSNSHVIDLASATGDVTLTLSNPESGASYIIKVIQDATTPVNLTWPAAVLWPDGVVPVVSTGASAVDVFSLFFDGTNYYATVGQNFS